MLDQHHLLQLLLHWIVSAAALAVTGAIVPGFRLRGFGSAMIASLLIGLANMFVWPVLVFFSLPFILVTLGLFLLVIDAVILRLCAAVMEGFEITGWIPALLGALLLSITSSFLHWLAAV